MVTEGEPADRFYVVVAGAAEVTQLSTTGEMHVHSYRRGDFFGEVGLLMDSPRIATVRAVSPVRTLTLIEPRSQASPAIRLDRAELARLADERRIRRPPARTPCRCRRGRVLLRRLFKHPRATHYNRLIAVVLSANAVIAGYGVASGWWSRNGTELEAVAVVAQGNLAFAIIFRQQYVINGLAWLATRARTTWPLRLRWMLGKYYHFGGLHVGGAIAGTLWYLAFVASLTHDLARDSPNAPVANAIVSYAVVVLFVVMVIMATPRLRAAQHDRFEVTHRFCGWAALALVWVNTVLFVSSQRGDGEPLASSLPTAPTVWMLVVTTAFAAWPWLLLRKVPITIERPSSHAVVITFDHGVKPPIGSTRPISRHPLVGWHHFANVPAAPGCSGYRMVISRAGDWTSSCIDDPPTHVWVRGIPTMGVANVRRLFSKVVLVATGSGIGPMLGHLLDRSVPSRLVWVTKNPRRTYGHELIDEIEAAQPDAIIWDTDERGKPDVLRLAYAAYLSSDAEAVVCIANRTVTWQVVHGLERCGIPAFGPIWDS